MARKVFISFLGTSNYVETIYDFPDGSRSNPVRFIQEALIKKICSDWSHEDKIYIFCTEDAQKNNWVDGGQKTEIEIEKIGLEHRLKENFNLFDIVEMSPIDEGFSENEVWSIFNSVYDKLQIRDNIYFDVTHAFRSIPMFSTVLFNFAQFMKDTKLVSVHYGAFEKLGPAYLVRRDIPVENRIAPVLDLTSIIQLQNFTQVASDFRNYGKAGGVGQVFDSYTGDRSFNLLVSGLRNNVEKVDEYILTNKVEKIKEGLFAHELKGQINKIRNMGKINHAQELLLSELEKALSKFSKNGGDKNILAAVEWALSYDMIQQAYTLAEEFIIMKVASYYESQNIFDNYVSWRSFISKLMSIPKDKILQQDFKDELAKDTDLTIKMLNESVIIDLRKCYPKISNNRNILCHAKETDLTVAKFKEQLKKEFDKCNGIINNLCLQNNN